MILETAPSYWSSAHRPIEFVYDHAEGFLFSVTDNGGFAAFRIIGMFSPAPVAGEQIYVAAGTYEGYHTISSVSGDVITTTTDYIDSDTGSNCSVIYIRLPEVKLYSGYLSGEEYDTELPITLVATFPTINSPDNDIQFDVSAYVQSIFRIQPPTIGIDTNMFNRYRLYFDGVYHEFYMALNSSITTAKLNELYVDTGAYLNAATTPLVFDCGNTILSYIAGSVVVNAEVTDGSTCAGFNSDFDNDFFQC